MRDENKTKKTDDSIPDLSRWSSQTAETVRQICLRKEAPCVAFSLIFFDPFVKEEEMWNYVIQMAHDRHEPPSDEDKKRLEKALEFINEGVKRIMLGEFDGVGYDKEKLS